jgi:hypothetical protein
MLTDQELQCAVSDDKHLLTDPVSLRTCRHLVCKKCLNDNDFKSITCNVCSSINHESFDKIEISASSKQEIKRHLDEIFEILKTEANMKVNGLKGNLNNLKCL